MNFITNWYGRNLPLGCLASAFLVMILAVLPAARANEPIGKSTNWELKGIRLGMPLSEALVLFPNLKCAEPGTGALRCADENETIVGMKATMMVHALDGTVVSVRFMDLTRSQSQQVMNAIQSKYGEADEYIVRKGSGDSDLYAAWRDGSPRIVVDPWADRPTNRMKDIRGQVMLIDNDTFKDKWLPRSYITKQTPSATNDI